MTAPASSLPSLVEDLFQPNAKSTTAGGSPIHRIRSGAPNADACYEIADLSGNVIRIGAASGTFYISVNGSIVSQADSSGGIFQTPNVTDVAYDTTPIGAIHIRAPTAASTRNFVAGLWVETNGSAVDKGRGILVNNTGASDGIYIQQDGVNGTGLAVLCTASGTGATGIVVGTILSSQVGLTLRQEIALVPTANCTTLLSVQAEGAATEMVQIGSAAVAAQVGVVFRLYGVGAKCIVVKDSLSNDKFTLTAAGAVIAAASATAHSATAIPAGGTAGAGYLLSSTANFGTFFGSGAPSLAAAKGSLYLRSDGSSGSTRAYINTDGSTTWTSLTTAA